jgi:hypothetical protein
MLTGVRTFAVLRIGSALVLLSSCGGGVAPPEDGIACTANLVAGISIRIFDAPSGNPAACGARATVTAPGFSEVDQISVTPCADSMPILAVFERPGTYSVVVSKTGYQDFTANNVVVTPGVCHVNTVSLDVRLSP